MASRKAKPPPTKSATANRPAMRNSARAGRAIRAGRPRRTPTERAKALALQEAYRHDHRGGRRQSVALPAIQAILRSQIGLAAKGNVQAQRAVLATIQTIEDENVLAAKFCRDTSHAGSRARGTATIAQDLAEARALADHNHDAGGTMSYVEAVQRIRTLLRLDEDKPNPDGEKDSGERGQESGARHAVGSHR